MGRIARLLDFIRGKVGKAHVTDAKGDLGGGQNVQAQHFSDAGDDSHPLPGDEVAVSSSPGAGRWHVTGYLDTKNEPKANPGEKRIYSRDSEGSPVAEIHLKADGSLVVLSLKSDAAVHLATDGTTHLGGVNVGDFVAMASKTDARIKALEDWATSFVNQWAVVHTHPHPMGPTSPPAQPAEPPTPGKSTASKKVRTA